MKAIVRDFDMVGGELSQYFPNDPQYFRIHFEVIVSRDGEPGGDIYSLTILSPKWFCDNYKSMPRFLRHILVVDEYDEIEIKKAINELVDNATGENWDEISEKLSRFMFSEFEDYQPFVSSDEETEN
jgi:hypothetical protein